METGIYKECADLNATFSYDIKCIDLHQRLTGVNNAHIISNLNYLMDRNVKM